MLSKDEILKKKGKSPEQLDLVSSLDADSSKTKSRLLLLLFLFIFVGSSSGLWIYREYVNGNLSFKFSPPKIPTITQIYINDKNAWQICLFDNTSKSLLYSQNCETTEIPSGPIENNANIIKLSLPNGLIISENIKTSTTEINYISKISSPKLSFLLTVKVFGAYPLESSQNQIPKLASDLYWKFSK